MIRVLALIFGLFPSILYAQTVSIRSGEHGGFTRLVFDIPSGSQWSLNPSGENTIRLSFETEGLSFDASSTFDRISKDRISKLKPVNGESSLDIVLDCQCVPDAFLLRDRMLVVDIKPDDVGIIWEESKEKPEKIVVNRPSDAPLIASLSQVRVGPTAGIGPIRAVDPLLPNLPISDRAERREVVPEINPSDIADQLARDLAVAASQGLLTPAVTAKDHETDAVALPNDSVKQSPEGPASDTDIAKRLAAGLSDLSHDTSGKGKVSIGGAFCVPDKTLAIWHWVPENLSVLQAISSARGDLFGEFDRIDQAALKVHVRTLLYYGFGTEARAGLRLGSDTPDPMLMALTYLMDGDADPSRWFFGQSGCETSAAFWSVLDSRDGNSTEPVNNAAVLRTLESLPRHLTAHLAPLLAEKLAELGERDAARDVLRRLQRMEGVETEQIALGNAQLDILDGDHEGAKSTLHALARSSGPGAADAVAASVDVADVTDTRLPKNIAELSAAFAKELRDSEDGPMLWRAHVRSLVLNGRFDDAFVVLNDDEGIPEEIRAEAREHALVALVDDGDDVTFLKVAFRPEILKEQKEDPKITIAFAERLLDLGMPEPAIERLKNIPDTASNPSARKSRARALLAMSRPEEAEILLIGLQGEDVDRLRAEARSRMGDHDYAKTVFAKLGANQDALDSAWLSGDWQDVASQIKDARSPAAIMVQSEQPSVSRDDPRLTDATRLSEASAASRQTLRDLLDATKISEDE